MDNGNLTRFTSLQGQVADVQSRYRYRLVDEVAGKGTADMMRILVQRGARPDFNGFSGEQFQYRQFYDDDIRTTQRYAGLLTDDAFPSVFPELQSVGLLLEHVRTFSNPLRYAGERQNPEMVEVILAQKPNNTIREGIDFVNRSGSLTARRSSLVDTETLPDAPPPIIEEIIGFWADAIIAQNGQPYLEPLALQVVEAGWNDVFKTLKNKGFDFSKVDQPYRFWGYWAGQNSACKPSTEQFLIGSGVDANYPLDPDLEGRPPLRIVAETCRNPDSAGALVKAGVADIYYAPNGYTLVDVAQSRRRPLMVQALRQLGAVSGDELETEGRKTTTANKRENVDWDIIQRADFH